MSEATIEEIRLTCRYLTNDASVAHYHGVPIKRVKWIRQNMPTGKQSGPAVIKPEDPGVGITAKDIVRTDKDGKPDPLAKALLEYGRDNGGVYQLSAEVCVMRLKAMAEVLS